MQTAFNQTDHTLYDRDLNMMRFYIKDAAKYVSLMSDTPMAEATKSIIDGIKSGKVPYTNPEVAYLARDGGDRTMKTAKMTELFKEIEDNNFIFSPNMTAYSHPREKKSVTSHYIETQLATRSANKSKMFEYRGKGDELMAGIYDNRQNRNKIKCNSLSGAQGTTSSILYLKSAHSSLTGTCRSATSNTNANVERLLSGNRHYHTVDVAINNVISVINNADMKLVLRAMITYGLTFPSADDVYEAIVRCTDLYFKDKEAYKEIRTLVDRLNPLELAAWLYTGDLFNSAKFNDRTIKELISGLVYMPSPEEAEEMTQKEADEYMSVMSDDEQGLIGIVCSEIMGGKKAKQIAKDTIEYKQLAGNAKSIFHTMRHFDLYFKAFMVNRSICPSMAMFPSAVRSIIVGSDTDSCIFTNQVWVEWFAGKIDDSILCFSTSAAVTYLCSQYTIHILAIMSGNMGVPVEQLRMLSMKNEYAFNFFALTTMAKHYFASQNACEGQVYSKLKWETKGVTLKNTNAPAEIQKKSEAFIKYLGTEINKGAEIKFIDVIQEVANIEHEVMRKMRSGDSDYFGRTKIHAQETYKKPAGWTKTNWGNHRHHVLWNKAFSHKYGAAPQPTYLAIKVKTELNSPTDWKNYVEQVEDPVTKNSLTDIFEEYKSVIKTFYLPKETVEQKGIPDDVFKAMNVRGMVANIMKSFYLILETLGFFMSDKRNSRLLSEEIEYDERHESILKDYL